MADPDPVKLQEAVNKTQLVEPLVLRDLKLAIEGLGYNQGVLVKDDTFEVVDRPKWKDMRRLMGCDGIEFMSMPQRLESGRPLEMAVDEFGKMKGGWEERVNPLASNLVELQDLIVGPAIVRIGDC